MTTTTINRNKLKGVITALVTPFAHGDVDLAAFRRLLRNQWDQGVRGFVINGTTGESPTLNAPEVKALFDCARAELGAEAALIVGTGTNSTHATCAFSREVAAWRPDALLVVVPYYNKPPQRGLKAHFQAVAEAASGVPILLYNVPSRTVAGLHLDTVVELSRVPGIVGIKEASGDLDFLSKLRAKLPAEFLLLSGDDGSCVDFCAGGGHGVISVSSHVIGAEMIECIRQSRVEEYANTYRDLMKWLYIEANPIPVKMAMHWMGIFPTEELRLPLVPLDPQHHKEFRLCLQKLGKL